MIPNILTTVRLFLIPVFAYFMVGNQNLTIAAIIFLLSGLTDIVDGIIARKFNMVTNIGKIYDPLVDKLMQITSVVCLVVTKFIPPWLLIIVIIKEASMIITGGILYLKKIVVYSHWYGKASTVIFYTIVVAFILFGKFMPPNVKLLLCVIIVFTMLFSAGAYLLDIIRNYDEKRIDKEQSTDTTSIK